MEEKIFEVKIISVNHMPQAICDDITRQVAKQSDTFKANYKGFAKITYVTASPVRISKIEPIEGTIIDYEKSIEGAQDFSVF